MPVSAVHRLRWSAGSQQFAIAAAFVYYSRIGVSRVEIGQTRLAGLHRVCAKRKSPRLRALKSMNRTTIVSGSLALLTGGLRVP